MRMSNVPVGMAEITILSGPQQGETFQLMQSPIHIGRIASYNGITNDIVLQSDSISRSHVEITWEKGMWVIRNLTMKNTTPNTLFVNEQEVMQRDIHNNDVIGLGKEVKIRFTSLVNENMLDPDSSPTVIHSDSSSSRVVATKKALAGPFRNLEHPAWTQIGILTSITGLIGMIEQTPSYAWLQIPTALTMLILCILIVCFAHMRSRPGSRQKLVPAAKQSKKEPQQAVLRPLIVTIVFLVIFALLLFFLATVGTFTINNISSTWGTIILLLGLLITFISFLATLSRLMVKGLLKKEIILWVSVATVVVSLAILVTAYIYYIHALPYYSNGHPAGLPAIQIKSVTVSQTPGLPDGHAQNFAALAVVIDMAIIVLESILVVATTIIVIRVTRTRAHALRNMSDRTEPETEPETEAQRGFQ